MHINWKEKLSSRKFLMAVSGFVSMLVVVFGGGHESAAQIAGLAVAGLTVASYIVGEGLADSGRPSAQEPEKEAEGARTIGFVREDESEGEDED